MRLFSRHFRGQGAVDPAGAGQARTHGGGSGCDMGLARPDASVKMGARAARGRAATSSPAAQGEIGLSVGSFDAGSAKPVSLMARELLRINLGPHVGRLVFIK